ncbi:FAD-binding dehydrogenase [Pseudomonas aeruginosa]|nr:FAD-binding dehydrogenase [Pseudomonas aeruginosa]AOX33475.1 FAD-binding dehydrogenase [Pseudomonas aeruginosa]AOX40088.1 FAD-binding dehydrogenase [Pseudomonas aeruginosa]APB57545.1 FAD-binding dehydrogenase [Pseudomonas aeruginosa]OGX68056.1 putative FAD-binding dehydrogenase [Pseudomonas aeruginosa]
MTSATVETTPLTCDVLVVGSGAAGLAAAVTAAWHGRRVVLVEKDPVFGGASAWSGGWAWLPRNPLARRAGIEEDIEQPRTYLRHELGERYDAARIDAFLEACPHMVAFFERHTHLRFVDGNGIPDMHGDTPGAAEGGHQLVAAPYDARQLGPLLPRLRKTLRETSFMGMPIMAGADLAAFLDLTRSLPAFLHVARRFSSHLWHLLRYGRAMHLVNGVALVARLAKSAEALGVRLIESAPARELLLRDGKVVGALVESAEGLLRIEAGPWSWPAAAFPMIRSAAPSWPPPWTPCCRCRRRAATATACAWGKAPAAGWPTTCARRSPGRRSREFPTAMARPGTSRTSLSAASPG